MVKLTPGILSSVTKPARYTGGEWNAAKKDMSTVMCRVAFSMPDVYEVGMSNLGLKILYEVLNRRDDTLAERVYALWPDMEKEVRERGIPLFTLETFSPVSSCDIVGFSLQYEMIYTNVLNMLDLAHIPLWSKERGENDPFVIGGGPCAYNSEPVADFFDFFVIGEGEEVVDEVVSALIEWKLAKRPGGRIGFLRRVAALGGIYVPSFYEPEYGADGMFTCMRVTSGVAPGIVKKRVVKDLDASFSTEKPIVPYIDIVHNRLMLELFRGCTRGCRFCQAGTTYRPVRERSVEKLLGIARKMTDATGYDEMSLTSLSSADYSCLGELIDRLTEEFRDEHMGLSLPSLRTDSFSIDLAKKIGTGRRGSLTFAPEAGTQRLRDVINKGVTEEDLIEAAGAAFEGGWTSLKLYFMIGLPTETDEDIRGIALLSKKVTDLYQRIKGRRGAKVTVSASCFVPKPYTPFQWFGQDTIGDFERKQRLLKSLIKDRAITFSYHDARVSRLEGVLARGDRRLSRVIYTAWRRGARFDGWSDLFREECWLSAFDECGVDPAFYNERRRDSDEPFPWEHTSPGVSRAFLLDEMNRALAASLTRDCRRGSCTGCGVCPSLGAKVIDWGRGDD